MTLLKSLPLWQAYASNFAGIEKEANLLYPFKFNSFTLQFHVVFHFR
ncbi:hypothetical protein [Nostoc sp. DedQUE04]|nr:hypothetical protein [Nostoc sp. DedQUE04]